MQRKEHRKETLFAPRSCPLEAFGTYMTTKMSQLKEILLTVEDQPLCRRGRPEAQCFSLSPRELLPRPAAGSPALTSPQPPCCAR